MAGPPRKPTALKLIGGTARNYRLNKSEPTPPRGIPRPPKHLSKVAKEAWNYAAPVLDEMGVLTVADAMVLEGLCESYSNLRDARALLAKEGRTYQSQTRDGGYRTYTHPAVAMEQDADRRFRMWLAEVGMTPAARSRVSAKAKESGSAWDDF